MGNLMSQGIPSQTIKKLWQSWKSGRFCQIVFIVWVPDQIFFTNVMGSFLINYFRLSWHPASGCRSRWCWWDPSQLWPDLRLYSFQSQPEVPYRKRQLKPSKSERKISEIFAPAIAQIRGEISSQKLNDRVALQSWNLNPGPPSLKPKAHPLNTHSCSHIFLCIVIGWFLKAHDEFKPIKML